MIESVRKSAIETLKLESEAVANLIPRIDDSFDAAIKCILACPARVVVTGMGKSGHIGRKIAATFASTGTPSFFMHPAEAFHGDLGMVTAEDVVIAISNSGESSEIVNILPAIRRIGAKIIALSGKKDSTLGKFCDYFINISVDREACPLNLAPTSSTTATLAMGDAMAVALMSEKKFTAQDFAMFHPGGALGRKLLLKVEDLMHVGEENPIVRADKKMRDALFKMTETGLGATSVIDSEQKFVGLITDGMIRRALQQDYNLLDDTVENFMKKDPWTIEPNELAASALSMMDKHKPRPITVLPVVDSNQTPVGMIHLTDLLRAGIV